MSKNGRSVSGPTLHESKSESEVSGFSLVADASRKETIMKEYIKLQSFRQDS